MEQQVVNKFISGKPICFILFGHSLEELDKRIEEFRYFDVIWVSMNWCELADSVLSKIGKTIDYHVWYEGANGTPHNTALRIKDGSGFIGNSMFIALNQMARDGIKEVYLFGADGFTPHNKRVPYYNYEQVKGAYAHNGHERHPEDLENFNNNYPTDLIKNSGIQIYNTSQISKYNIPKITLDECITRLKHQVNTSSKTP